MKNFNLLLVITTLCFFASSSKAEKTKPGLFYTQEIGVCYNPLGLIIDSKLYYRTPFINKPGVLFESTKFECGLQNELTPADNLISVRGVWEPIALCDVVIKAGAYGMFNQLGYGCYRLSSATDSYSDATRNSLKPGCSNGYWLSVTPTIKAQLGSVIALNSVNINHIAINGNGYYLEVRSFLPHKTIDLDIINDTYLLYECSNVFMIGATYHYAFVTGTKSGSQRLSAITIIKQETGMFKGLYAAVNAGFYFLDPLYKNTFYFGGLIGKEFKIEQLKK